MDIAQKDVLVEELENISGDYKAEVIAAEIVRNGVKADDIFFSTRSSFKRFVSKDVNNFIWENIDYVNNQLNMELNREGIYDMLPEGITHFNPYKSGKNTEEILVEIKRQRMLEKAARKFFSPIENEIIHRRLQLEITERDAYNGLDTDSNRSLFESLYGEHAFLNDRQVLILLYLMPLSDAIKADTCKIALTLSSLLDKNVTVHKYDVTEQVKMNPGLPTLGEAVLGVDSICGSCFRTKLKKYVVQVNGIAVKEYVQFLPQKNSRKLIDFVIDSFIPNSSFAEVILNADEQQKDFKLCGDGALAYLSFNSYI